MNSPTDVVVFIENGSRISFWKIKKGNDPIFFSFLRNNSSNTADPRLAARGCPPSVCAHPFLLILIILLVALAVGGIVLTFGLLALRR